jgi:hypothetical protein
LAVLPHTASSTNSMMICSAPSAVANIRCGPRGTCMKVSTSPVMSALLAGNAVASSLIVEASSAEA